MDGLVLDSEKLYCRYWAEAARCFGFPMTFQQGMGMRALCKEAGEAKLRSYFGPEADYTAIRAKRIELMAEAQIDAKPGIFELLDFLREQGIPAAITSSSPPDRIRYYLSQVGLEHRFTALCSGHEVKRGKPDPDIYLHGAATLGLAPENCLALEDAPAGIEAAWRAGCVAVMVPDLDQPDEKTVSMLHAKADSLLDIIDYLNL